MYKLTSFWHRIKMFVSRQKYYTVLHSIFCVIWNPGDLFTFSSVNHETSTKNKATNMVNDQER